MDESKIKDFKQLAKGIPASPGAASGIVVFDVKKAIELGDTGKKNHTSKKGNKTRRCSGILFIRRYFDEFRRKVISCRNCFKRNGKTMHSRMSRIKNRL